jgi:hypothetical protein
MKKVNIIRGHEIGAGGADNYLGQSEHEFYSEFFKPGKEPAIPNANTCYWSKEGYDYSEINPINPECGIDVSIEMHFNWGPSPQADGQEAVVLHGDNASAEFAREFIRKMSERNGIRPRHDRGIKWISGKGRGGVCLRNIKHAKVKFLYEPGFGNFRTPESEYLFENGGAAFKKDFVEVLGEMFEPIEKSSKIYTEIMASCEEITSLADKIQNAIKIN